MVGREGKIERKKERERGKGKDKKGKVSGRLEGEC